MRALSGTQVLQDNSRSTWIQSSDRPVKLSFTTGHTVMPALFSGYPVSTIDVINCVRLFQQLAHNTDNYLHYLLLDMRDSSITNRLRSANKFPLIFAKTNKFKSLFICYKLSQFIFLSVIYSVCCIVLIQPLSVILQ